MDDFDGLKVSKILINQLGFSDCSIVKLKKFHNYLIEYNKRYNLISKKTEKNIWFRHILDSAQLIRFFDPSKILRISDFGSGAGFPGLILAIYAENSKFHVKLYEKSPIKRSFLRKILLDLKITNVTVENNVYGKTINDELIVCRAFKKLDEIISISREMIKKPHKIIILKGKNAQNEINNLSLPLNYSYKLKESITDDDSKIVIFEVK